MRCSLCNQGNVDGAIDNHDDFICIDCWIDGSAFIDGRVARVASPVDGVVPTNYSISMRESFVNSINNRFK